MQTKLNVWTQTHYMIYLVFNTLKLSMVPPVGMVVWKYSIWENLASHVHLSSWYHYSYTGKVNTRIMPGVSVLYLSRKYYKHFLIFFFTSLFQFCRSHQSTRKKNSLTIVYLDSISLQEPFWYGMKRLTAHCCVGSRFYLVLIRSET